MRTFEITIVNEHGLHARPAGMLVKMCSRFEGSVKVTKDRVTVDGKSLLGMLKLAAKKGDVLSLHLDEATEEAKLQFEHLVTELALAGFDEA